MFFPRILFEIVLLPKHCCEGFPSEGIVIIIWILWQIEWVQIFTQEERCKSMIDVLAEIYDIIACFGMDSLLVSESRTLNSEVFCYLAVLAPLMIIISAEACATVVGKMMKEQVSGTWESTDVLSSSC